MCLELIVSKFLTSQRVGDLWPMDCSIVTLTYALGGHSAVLVSTVMYNILKFVVSDISSWLS